MPALISAALAGCGESAAPSGPMGPDAGTIDSGPSMPLLTDGDAGADSGIDAMVDAGSDTGGSPNVVFVTSSAYPAHYGIAAYDLMCEQLAREAGWTGTFVALLSTTEASAYQRIAGARGWVNSAGAPFADTAEELAGGQTFGPILDERGNPLAALAWTGSHHHLELARHYPEGHLLNCDDWSSQSGSGTIGDPNAGTGSVFYIGYNACALQYHLYCAQVDRRVEVRPLSPTPARRVFLATGAWDKTDGIESADGLCAAEASNIPVGGSFIALLADVGTSAVSRLTGPLVPWVRLDGALLWDPATNPADATQLVTSPSLTIEGRFVGWWGATTGAATPMTPGTVETTCNGWSEGPYDPDVHAVGGHEANRDQRWFGNGPLPCGGTGRVYCIEQLSD